MFQRGGPASSDDDFGHFYGLALPFVKRGMPVQPIQLENVTLRGYLDDTKVLLMTYEGMKPLSSDVHDSIAAWVKAGGTLVFVDDDRDPFNGVREWWNSGGLKYRNPRTHLFDKLNALGARSGSVTPFGRGRLLFLRESPNRDIARKPGGDRHLVEAVRTAATNLPWRETSSLVLRRGPYIIAAGMDESEAPQQTLKGRFIDLFDSELRFRTQVDLGPGTRHFLVDLDRFPGTVVASAGYAHQEISNDRAWRGTIEGQSGTEGIIFLRTRQAPKSATIDGKDIADIQFDGAARLLRMRFPLTSAAQTISVQY
jgi:hypothetical protein